MSLVKLSTMKRLLKRILMEYGPSLRISYALLYKPYDGSNHILILKFKSGTPDDHAFEMKLDFVTLLPPMRLDIYDVRDIPSELLKHVFKHGEVLYVGDYEEYLRDLENGFTSTHEEWRYTELMGYA